MKLSFTAPCRFIPTLSLQDCSPAYGGLSSRGFSPASYPTKPLGSYHVLPTSTWVNPPFTGDLRRWGAQVVDGYAVIQDLGAFADAFKGRNLDIRIELLTAVLALLATVDSERLSRGFPGRGRRA